MWEESFITGIHLFPQVSCANSCEMCQEAFKSKHARELQCGHRLHKGVRVLCGTFHATHPDCGVFRKKKGTFSPKLQSLHLPSKFQACCVRGHHPPHRDCAGGGGWTPGLWCTLHGPLRVGWGEHSALSVAKIQSVISLQALTRTVKQTVK